MKIRCIILLIATLLAGGAYAQRHIDKLDRGLVAIPQGDKTGVDKNYGPSGSGMFVSWRVLPTEYYDTKYNLYRNGTKLNAQPLAVSNYQDNGGTSTSQYTVVPVVRGKEMADQASSAVTPWPHQYWEIPVQKVINRAGTDVTDQYSLNDCSVADVDGDGQMEFVVKRRNDSGLRDAGNTTTFNRHECYKMDGTLLWYIDMGPNMMAGADEQFDLILYDWDLDGRAEALMRGADNMIIHTATDKDIKIGNMNYYAPRDEYTCEGAEYLLYLNGSTGEPYGWDGSDNWTPADYPLPRFEQGESDYGSVWGKAGDGGHRATKHYFGAPYLDGRNPSIFLGRGCYTRHKFCALQVNPLTHELTQLWRWNCYDGSSPWFGNGFHNFAIADVDMDGRDEIVFGSMIIDDTGYGLATTGFGHGDAQHCGDLDPYAWGLEQFVCLESLTVPGMALTDATSQTVRYSSGTGGDNGRCMAGNFQGTYPGAVGRSAGGGLISFASNRVIEGDDHMASDDYWNMRVYWDGDLLDEFMDSPGVEREACVYKYGGQTEVGTGRAAYTNSRAFLTSGCALNNSSKNNPCFLGDIIGDWREEIVVRSSDNKSLRIYTTNYASPWGITTLWADHEYRNAMTWQCIGYNQPPHPSFFLGELEGITNCPPALTLEARTEVSSGTISQTDGQLLISGYEDHTISVADGASPWVLYVNAPAWIQGTGVRQAVASTPKQPTRNTLLYTTTLTGGAFGGDTRLVKQGEGVLVLPNVVEKHSGATDVWQGTLQFDGTMEQSPVWLNRHTTLITDGGRFMGGLKADYNATIYPGGKEQVGSLTASDLQLGFGSRVVIDVKDGQTDQVNATKLTIETKSWQFGPKYKAPVVEFNCMGTIADGTYLLGTVDELAGSVSDLVIEGIGDGLRAVLTYENQQLQLLISSQREATTVIWNGSTGNNTWEQAIGNNFLNDGQPDYAALGDDIIFDDNAAITTVNIKGGVTPNSITFNNETKNYTINGDSILGGGTITKNGKGKVTLNTENHTGETFLNGGTTSVAQLANLSGQTYGSLGDASQVINMADGATLQANGTIKTDQRFRVSGEVTIDVPTGKDLIMNNSIIGAGATVVKTGAGSMQTGLGNTYKKLIVKQGSVTSQESDKAVQQVPDTIEFQGGTFYDFNNENTYSSNTANFVVPAGKTGTFYGDPRCDYKGKLLGSGTFNVYGTWIRCRYQGNWSQFEGTVVPGVQDRSVKHGYSPEFSFCNSYGLPKATLKLNAGVTVYNRDPDSGTAYNVTIGNITGTGTLAGSGTYTIGTLGNNILASFHSTAPIVKRGEGYLQVSGVGNLSGSVAVEEGQLRFNDTKLEEPYFGALTLRSKGTMQGGGLLPSLTMDSGTEATAASMYSATTPRIIKVTASANIKSGATFNFVVKSAAAGQQASPGYSQLQARFLTFNGTVKVTLTDNYAPKVGDELTLWTASSSFTGTPAFDLPELPDGLYWDTAAVAQKTGVLRITDVAPDDIATLAIDPSVVVDAQVYTLGGTALGAVRTERRSIAAAVRQLGLKPGLYIVRMQSGQGRAAETIVVR